jgi:hypothetical protein
VAQLAEPADGLDDMKHETFLRLAQAEGFSGSQAEFLWEHLSKPGHEHTAEQITDLDEAVDEILKEEWGFEE